MRWFTSCQPASPPMSPSDLLDDDVKNLNSDKKSNWREYEKQWEDSNGNWKGKIWVKKWSSNGWSDGEYGGTESGIDNNNQDREHVKENKERRGGIRIGFPPFIRSDREVDDGKELRSALIGSKDEDEKTIDEDGEHPVKTGRLQSRNLVILDTMLRSSYQAGYNDALKIRPFLPYSTSTSPSTSSTPSTLLANESDNRSNSNSSSKLFLTGLILLCTTGIGIITFATLNRLKNVESGLKETLALVQLGEKNDLNGLGKLGRELAGIRKLIEEKTAGMTSVNGEEGLDLVKMNEINENRWKIIQDNLNNQNTFNSNKINEDKELRISIEGMKNDIHKEFRIIAKDFNANQNDSIKIQQYLENLQKTISNLSSNQSHTLEEMNNKISKDYHRLDDKLHNLSKILNGDLSSEISLSNQFSIKNLKLSEEVKGILQGLQIDLKDLKEKELKVKDKSIKPTSKSKSSASGSSDGNGSSGGTTPPSSSASPPASPASSAPEATSQYGNRLMNSLGLNLGGNADIMPLGDIKAMIQGVQKSYLDNQNEDVETGESPNEKESGMDNLIKDNKGNDISNMDNQAGPIEGTKFSTPLHKVKNPYLKCTQPEEKSLMDEKDNSYKYVPTLRSTRSTTRKDKKDDDDENNSPPPSGPGMSKPKSSSASPSSPSPSPNPTSSQPQQDHWWTIHSLPHSNTGLSDSWKIKGFGWYHPSSSSSSDKVRADAKREKKQCEEDRSIGAWAVGRVRRKFGDWPFH